MGESSVGVISTDSIPSVSLSSWSASPTTYSTDEKWTMAPPPTLRVEGTTARVPRYVPVKLMSITWRQAAGSVSVQG